MILPDSIEPMEKDVGENGKVLLQLDYPMASNVLQRFIGMRLLVSGKRNSKLSNISSKTNEKSICYMY